MFEKPYVVTPEFIREIFSCLSLGNTDASDWEYHLSGIFAEFMPVGVKLPVDGWKLRINVCLENNIPLLLQSVIRVLYRERTPFKILADPMVHLFCYSKKIPGEIAGKFLTVYIPDGEDLKRIATDLAVLIAPLGLRPCIHPISDSPVDFSKNISYRYGAYTDSTMVRDGNGNFIEDCREFFRLPPGITDPFTGTGMIDEEDDGPVRIGGDYQIQEVIHRTYPSAVYIGTRTSDGLEIVLKEARPDCYVDGVLGTKRLQNEYSILKKIASSVCSDLCPMPLALFAEEGHLFLAMTKIQGATLYEWRQHKQNQDPASHLRIARKIAEILDRLNTELCIAWGDVHASNVLVDDSENVYFIDPECAMCTCDFTIDAEMLGRLLLWLVFNDDIIFEPDCYPDVFLQKLEKMSDYPSEYKDAVNSALKLKGFS